MICNQDFPNSSALQDHMSVSHMETSSSSNSTDAPPHQPQSAANVDQKPGIHKPGTLFVAPPDPGPASSQQQTKSASSPVPIFMNLPLSMSSSSSSSPPLPSASLGGGAPFCQSSPSGPIFSHPGLPVGFSRPSTSSGRVSLAQKEFNLKVNGPILHAYF